LCVRTKKGGLGTPLPSFHPVHESNGPKTPHCAVRGACHHVHLDRLFFFAGVAPLFHSIILR
jgi:hypothetical protein